MIDDWWLRIEDWGLTIDYWCRPWTKNLPWKCLPNNPHGWSHFQCQVNIFDTYWVVYPSSKEVSPKVRALRAMTRSDASPYADQKIIALPKPHFFWKIRKFSQKKIPKKSFQRRKLKNCKSSETCFAEVSCRSEPCSRGKRPFEVSKKKKTKFASWRSKR